MGSTFTTPPKSIKSEIIPIAPYVCATTNRKIIVSSDISLVLRPSKLSTTFIEGKNMGVFTEKFIPNRTIIMTFASDPIMAHKFNDAAMDLTSILQGDTSEKAYQAWMNTKKSYYNLENIKQVINVRLLGNVIDEIIGHETIQDIPADTELTRIYGFTAWVLELSKMVTNKNIVGFAQFVNYLMNSIDSDPHEDKIKNLHVVLSQYGIKDIFTIDRNEYDESMRDEPMVNVGDEL